MGMIGRIRDLTWELEYHNGLKYGLSWRRRRAPEVYHAASLRFCGYYKRGIRHLVKIPGVKERVRPWAWLAPPQ